MCTDPQFVIRVLEHRGCHLRLDEDRLIARMVHGKVPADLAGVIRHFKPILVAELQERERLAETVSNVLALSEADQQAWAKEVQDTAPGEPHYDHDHRALREVARLRQAAKNLEEMEEAA